MKKFISLLLVMMLALSFAACGGNTESPTASPNAEQQTEAATPTALVNSPIWNQAMVFST